MSPASKVADTALVPKGGEHISRLVETRRGKKIFLQSKNFLLMRYNEARGCLSPPHRKMAGTPFLSGRGLDISLASLKGAGVRIFSTIEKNSLMRYNVFFAKSKSCRFDNLFLHHIVKNTRNKDELFLLFFLAGPVKKTLYNEARGYSTPR